MGWKPKPSKPLDDRPGGKRVLKKVKLPDGREIEFEVFVIDSPSEAGAGLSMRVQPKSPDGGYGRVPRRGVN